MKSLQNKAISKTVCALLYLSGRAGATDKLRLSRLLYLADKYHFMTFRETITDDRYVAMGIGPAGVRAMIIFNAWALYTGMFEKDAALSLFCQTEKDAMDFIVEKFNGLGDEDLEAYMLALPEWKVARKLFDVKASLTGGQRRLGPDGQVFYPIETEDLLLLNDGDAYFKAPQEHDEEHDGETRQFFFASTVE